MNEIVKKEISFEEARQFIKTISAESMQKEVESFEDAKQALSMSLQARKLKNSVRDAKKKILEPHIDYVKSINSIVEQLQETLQSIEDRLVGKILNFREKETDSFATFKKIVVEDGTLSISHNLDFTISDIDLVPEKYKTVDFKLIQEDLKNGLLEIPGVEVFPIEKISLRVNNK